MGEPEAARTVFEGKILALRLERWGGRELEVVGRADSVAVVAVDREGALVLVRQFRAPARRHLLELPAGTVGERERPEATARRELEEETGLRGGHWRSGPSFFTTPGFCRERIHLFFAEELEPGEARPGGGEEIELVRFRAHEIESRLDEIEDAKTLTGLVLYLRGLA